VNALSAGTHPSNNLTVHDDGFTDQLTGASGDVWFFARCGTAAGAECSATDVAGFIDSRKDDIGHRLERNLIRVVVLIEVV